MKRLLLPTLMLLAVPLAAQTTTEPLNTPEQKLTAALNKNEWATVKELLDATPTLLTSGERSGGQTLLNRAIQASNLEMVKYLLEKGADPNRDSYGTSPLGQAVGGYREGSWKEIAALLVEKGADIDRVDGDGQTPLIRVISRGYDNKREKVEWLLSKGADINAKGRSGGSALEQALASGGNNADILRVMLEKVDAKRRDDDDNTYLHLATPRANADTIRLLLEKGVEINAQNGKGDTALHLAGTNTTKIKQLLDAGANANIKNFRGDLPLHAALRPPVVPSYRNIENVYVGEEGTVQPATPRGTLLAPLTEKTDINVKDRFGISPLLLAVQIRDQETRDLVIERAPKMDATTKLFDAVASGNTADLATLLTQKPFLVYFRLPDGTTPLHVSALWGTQGAANLLLQKGADVNAKDARGETPLMKSLWKPTGIFSRRAKNMQALLLSKNADINAVDSSDASALHRAVQAGDLELITPLLAKNARVDMRDTTGQSPLGLAITKTGSIEIVKQLLEKGANPKARGAVSGVYGGSNMTSPLARAVSARRLDMVKLLIEKGASAAERNPEGRGLLGSLVDNYGGESDSSREIFALLLEKGADPNEKYYSESLIYRVIGRSDENAREFLKLLLATKKVSLKTTDNRQPILTYAVQMGRKDAVEVLIGAGADVNEKDSQGNSALKLAKRYNNAEIIALLAAKNAVE